MKVRACWSALEGRVEQVLITLRTQTIEAQRLRDSLNSSQERLERLYEEYRAKGAAALESKGMSDAMNHRQFMSQLLNLRARVEQDIEKSTVHLERLAFLTQKAEADRLKMKTLAENDRLAVQKHWNKREQRSMDTVSSTHETSHRRRVILVVASAMRSAVAAARWNGFRACLTANDRQEGSAWAKKGFGAQKSKSS
jgi:flagellar biosynthesis chaperone FliJ